jgi:predicted transcriptional regulator
MLFLLVAMLDPTYRDFRRVNYEPQKMQLDKEIYCRPASTFKRPHKKHRNKEEMIADILKASRHSATTKTRIMRTCYISYNLVQKYLRYAVENGLVFGEPRSNKYHITSKGMQYLAYFEQYRDTESELALKKKAISQILDKDEESMPNAEQMAQCSVTKLLLNE